MAHICILVARFYEDIADELVKGALLQLARVEATHDIIEVPGAFELPAATAMAIASGKYAGYLALGCVIRGETTHYDYVCAESARGLNDLAIKHHAPIGYGVLTVENEEQAWVRARVNEGNKGADAATACLRMLEVRKEMIPA